MPVVPPSHDLRRLESREFVIQYTVEGVPHFHSTLAAYYQIGELFTEFKNTDNKVVFMVRNDFLVSVTRCGEPQDGQVGE